MKVFEINEDKTRPQLYVSAMSIVRKTDVSWNMNEIKDKTEESLEEKFGENFDKEYGIYVQESKKIDLGWYKDHCLWKWWASSFKMTNTFLILLFNVFLM